jgi:hypothetical protein
MLRGNCLLLFFFFRLGWKQLFVDVSGVRRGSGRERVSDSSSLGVLRDFPFSAAAGLLAACDALCTAQSDAERAAAVSDARFLKQLSACFVLFSSGVGCTDCGGGLKE